MPQGAAKSTAKGRCAKILIESQPLRNIEMKEGLCNVRSLKACALRLFGHCAFNVCISDYSADYTAYFLM
jgi:hypothetical protein